MTPAVHRIDSECPLIHKIRFAEIPLCRETIPQLYCGKRFRRSFDLSLIHLVRRRSGHAIEYLAVRNAAHIRIGSARHFVSVEYSVAVRIGETRVRVVDVDFIPRGKTVAVAVETGQVARPQPIERNGCNVGRKPNRDSASAARDRRRAVASAIFGTREIILKRHVAVPRQFCRDGNRRVGRTVEESVYPRTGKRLPDRRHSPREAVRKPLWQHEAIVRRNNGHLRANRREQHISDCDVTRRRHEGAIAFLRKRDVRPRDADPVVCRAALSPFGHCKRTGGRFSRP